MRTRYWSPRKYFSYLCFWLFYSTNVFSKNIFYSLFWTISVFWPGLFFQIIREKREKFCREYLGQTWTQVVCDSHRFHGVKFCQNLSRSQTFKQTIQIISDNGILNWKPKSISFENQILNLKIFLHLKWFFFFFEQWKKCKTNSLEKFCLFQRDRSEDKNPNVSTISRVWSVGAHKSKHPLCLIKSIFPKRNFHCIVKKLCYFQGN